MGVDPVASDQRTAPERGRRRLCRILQVTAPLGLALAAGFACAPPSPNPHPNIVLVVMDTTRADRCSVNGYERPTTPQLEALAADGAVFLQCWSPASWTVPAHASLFTGLRPEHHGVMHGNRRYLSPEAVTLAERFAADGYATACFTNNPNLHASTRLTQGFETVRELWIRRSVSTAFGRGPKVAVEDLRHRTAAETYELGLAWARSQQAAGRPFFLFVNVMEPHLTYDPPAALGDAFLPPLGPDRAPADEQWARRFKFPECVGASLRAVLVAPARRRLLSDLYDAEIAAADDGLRTLLGGLRDMGVYDETAIVVTADHGENLGEHGLYDHVLSLNASLRRVPLVVRYPGAFDGGRRVQDVVRLEDVFPTLLELGGQRVPADIDAVSLLRDLGGRVAYAALGERNFMTGYIHAAFPHADLDRAKLSWRAVFDGRHHLIRDSRGGYELYDLREDPGETRDLSGKDPQTLERMVRVLERAYPTRVTAR